MPEYIEDFDIFDEDFEILREIEEYNEAVKSSISPIYTTIVNSDGSITESVEYVYEGAVWEKIKAGATKVWNAIKRFFTVTIPNLFRSLFNSKKTTKELVIKTNEIFLKLARDIHAMFHNSPSPHSIQAKHMLGLILSSLPDKDRLSYLQNIDNRSVEQFEKDIHAALDKKPKDVNAAINTASGGDTISMSTMKIMFDAYLSEASFGSLTTAIDAFMHVVARDANRFDKPAVRKGFSAKSINAVEALISKVQNEIFPKGESPVKIAAYIGDDKGATILYAVARNGKPLTKRLPSDFKFGPARTETFWDLYDELMVTVGRLMELQPDQKSELTKLRGTLYNFQTLLYTFAGYATGIRGQITTYAHIADVFKDPVYASQDPVAINKNLKKVTREIGIKLPWDDAGSFEDFMADKNNTLTFG